MLMDGVRQTRNTAMAISVGNDNMLGNMLAILMLMTYVKCAICQWQEVALLTQYWCWWRSYVNCTTRQWHARISVADTILMLMADVCQTGNTTMVIGVGNGNMLGNINGNDVRQMCNTTMARSSAVDAILMLIWYVKCATRLWQYLCWGSNLPGNES